MERRFPSPIEPVTVRSLANFMYSNKNKNKNKNKDFLFFVARKSKPRPKATVPKSQSVIE